MRSRRSLGFVALGAALAGACRDPAPQILEPLPSAEARRPAPPAPPPRATAEAPPLPDSGAGCPRFARARAVGTVENDDIDEASGIVASRSQPGVLWAHNDSGDGPRLYAMSREGKHLGVFELEGALAFDWEDVAIGPGKAEGTWDLFVGETGGNIRVRHVIEIHRAREPEVDPKRPAANRKLKDFETYKFRYGDRKPHDSEALAVDPTTGELFVVTKEDDGPALVFGAKPPFATDRIVEIPVVGRIDLDATAARGNRATALDVSPRGDLVLLRTYDQAFVWRREAGQPLVSAFEGKRCEVPVAKEPQGEAATFDEAGRGYYTLSENKNQPLYYFEPR